MRKLVLGACALAMLGACSQPDAATPLSGDALIARGDYLVNGVVLCGDCHTPRDETGALIMERALQGAPFPGPPDMPQVAPPIAGIPANYTEDALTAFLQTGVRPDGSHARPPMPPYRLNEEDARAVAAYIHSLPAAPAQQ